MDDERLQRYVEQLFAAEDSVLARVRARHAEQHLPPIHISPDEGKLIHVLLRAIGVIEAPSLTFASRYAYSSRSARFVLRLASVVGRTSGVNRARTRSESFAWTSK